MQADFLQRLNERVPAAVRGGKEQPRPGDVLVASEREEAERERDQRAGAASDEEGGEQALGGGRRVGKQLVGRVGLGGPDEHPLEEIETQGNAGIALQRLEYQQLVPRAGGTGGEQREHLQLVGGLDSEHDQP